MLLSKIRELLDDLGFGARFGQTAAKLAQEWSRTNTSARAR